MSTAGKLYHNWSIRKFISYCTIYTAPFIIVLDNRVFVNGDSVNEYVHPSKFIDLETRKAKLAAAGELPSPTFKRQHGGKGKHFQLAV